MIRRSHFGDTARGAGTFGFRHGNRDVLPVVTVYRIGNLEYCSPTTRAKVIGKSDWEVVQRAFAPFNSVMYGSGAGEQGCCQPFDMPMAHIECHDDNATIVNTELVVFCKEHLGETQAAFWQRFVRDSEDWSDQVKCASGSITVARACPDHCSSVDPDRPL